MNITPNIFQRSIQRFAATSLGSKLFIPTAHRADRIVLRLSGGRTTLVGLTTGLPVITLTTIGAKSGQLRTVPLVGIPDGDRWVVIASNFGQAHHPAWYYNLKKNPQATVAPAWRHRRLRSRRSQRARNTTASGRKRFRSMPAMQRTRHAQVGGRFPS